MNGCPYNVSAFGVPRNVVPRRVSSSSGVSFTTFVIFALLVVFLISEVYNYARKVCSDHQRRMRLVCVSHQAALDSKLNHVCSAHQKMFEDRLEEVRCKCHCECDEEEIEDEETDSVKECCEKDETVKELNEFETLASIPEHETFSGFKTD